MVGRRTSTVPGTCLKLWPACMCNGQGPSGFLHLPKMAFRIRAYVYVRLRSVVHRIQCVVECAYLIVEIVHSI